MKPVRLAIVDDAAFVRSALVRLLDGTPVTVVGAAKDGEELMRHIDEWAPDVITLDLHMPGMGGMRTLDRVMSTRPTPVIIMSTHSGEGAPLTVEALGRGAADFIDKEAYSLIDFDRLRRVIVEKATALAGRDGPAPRRGGQRATARPVEPSAAGNGTGSFGLAVLGASTGGPSAVEEVLAALGSPSVPIAVVQHMSSAITSAFAERLDRTLGLHVREAVDGEPMKPGVAYIAPGGLDMRIEGSGEAPEISIREAAADAYHRPSVDVLFESVARLAPERTVAVLMTGMGSDGARGMRSLRQAGAHTIAQDEESCVVYGMPRAAVEADAVEEVLPLSAIGPRLRSLVGGG